MSPAPPDVGALINNILSTMLSELAPEGDSPLDERDIFAGAVRDLLTPPTSRPQPPDLQETLHTRLRALLALARQRVAHTPFHLVTRATLRGYTDASVLLAVLFLLGEERQGWRDVVQLLDRAIIVAGAVGPRRLEWVHALIGALQPPRRGVKRRRSDSGSPTPHPRSPSQLSSSSPPPSYLPPASPPPAELLFAPAPIPTPSTPPPLTTAPFILRAYLSSGTHHPAWPALSRWQSADYLLFKTGRGRLVPVECGRAYDDSGWTQRLLGWEGFLQRAGWDCPASEEDEAPQYLAQTSLFRQFPGLEGDMATPDYVWAPTSEEYKPPPEVLVNAWVGPGGHEVVSPAHTDPYYNCYAQVLGYKRVWLAPPDASPHMYAYAGGGETVTEAPASLADEYMTNTSRVPLLRPAHDGSFTKLQPGFPGFFEHVYPRAMEAVLGPGDMLVMPPGWWHAMRGEGRGPCWSVSFWF